MASVIYPTCTGRVIGPCAPDLNGYQIISLLPIIPTVSIALTSHGVNEIVITYFPLNYFLRALNEKSIFYILTISWLLSPIYKVENWLIYFMAIYQP